MAGQIGHLKFYSHKFILASFFAELSLITCPQFSNTGGFSTVHISLLTGQTIKL